MKVYLLQNMYLWLLLHTKNKTMKLKLALKFLIVKYKMMEGAPHCAMKRILRQFEILFNFTSTKFYYIIIFVLIR